MSTSTRLARLTGLGVAAVVLAACSQGPGPARVPRDPTATTRHEGAGSASGGATGVRLAPGGPVSLGLPSAPPLRLALPPGAAAALDLTAPTPTVVVTIANTELGFGVADGVPADPQAATALVKQVVATLEASGRTDLTSVRVTGYASSEGSTQSNQQLSEARAQWVCQALQNAGVAATAITCAGRGEASDLPPNGPGPEDRRVEIRARIDRP